MNKLSADQLKKIALSSLMMLVLIYCYFTFLITPTTKSDAENLKAIAQLDQQLADAHTAILRTRSIEDQARTAEETLAQVNDMIPDGAPIAWFPPKIHAFLDRQNLKDSIVRPNGDAVPEPTMGELKTRKWSVDIPQSGFSQLGIALAGLENEDKLLEVSRLQISTQPDHPENQHVVMNVTTLLK